MHRSDDQGTLGYDVAQLPPARYATGSAVGTCARQIGAVLGLSVLLSGLAAAGSGPAAFRTAWVVMAAGAVVTAACGIVVGAVRVAPAAFPVPPAVPVPPIPAEESR